MITEFLALLPQKTRENPIWTQFSQLYTDNSSFREWFRQLQTITAPILQIQEVEDVSFIYMDRVLEELGTLHPSFIEKMTASQWGTFMLEYLLNPSFPIQAFEFQTFIASNYRDKHQLMLEQQN